MPHISVCCGYITSLSCFSTITNTTVLMFNKRGPHHNSKYFHPNMWHIAVSSHTNTLRLLPCSHSFGGSERSQKPQPWFSEGSGTSLLAGRDPAPHSSLCLCSQPPLCLENFSPAGISVPRVSTSIYVLKTLFDVL